MNEPIAYYQDPPHFSKACDCGITITGSSEKGLQSLIRRHIEKGSIHLEWSKNKQ